MMIFTATTGTKIKGVALITVMLVVALAAIIATQMMARLQLQVQRTTNIAFNQQAYWYAMGAEAFAKRVLITTNKEDPEITHLSQAWAQGETSYPVDYGQIAGEITDLHACLNLNALQDNSTKSNPEQKNIAREAFERLVVAINIEGVDEFSAQYMADALSDWLDSDSDLSSAGGAEDSDYASKEHSYLAANGLLASVNELRVIEHFTVPVINALKPYVCVLPSSNSHQININTLSAEQPELLSALLDIPRVDAESALAARDAEGFSAVEDFFTLPELSKLKVEQKQKDQFVVDSEYFKLKTNANFNESYFAMTSIFKVEQNDRIKVISRMIGRN